MNPDALFSRAAAAALPEGSKEHALATLALRRLWHAVFDPCPELSRLFGEKNREFLDPFLEHAAKENLTMRWSLHAHLLLWMKERRSETVTPALAQELLAAAAARWANEDQSNDQGAILHVPDLKDSAVVVWKLRSPEEDVRVVLVKIPEPNHPGTAVYFTTFPEQRYPDALSWRLVTE
jgi:hypothetical protein